MRKNSEVLSPVNIMQSNFSMLLPSSDDQFLVTARAVKMDGTGAAVGIEMFNISHKTAKITSKSTNPSNTGSNNV